MSKNGVKHRVSVALTVQRYNGEIALYEFLGNFFSGKRKSFSAGVTVSWCHGVKVVFESVKGSTI